MLIEHFNWKYNSTLKLDSINIGDKLEDINHLIESDTNQNDERKFDSYHLKNREKFHVLLKDGVVERIVIFDSFKFKGQELIQLDKDSTIKLLDEYFQRIDNQDVDSEVIRVTFSDLFVRLVGLIK